MQRALVLCLNLTHMSESKIAPYFNLSERFMGDDKAPNILGRDDVIKMMCITLLRKRKPNVMLVGDAGVGKTAIVEELAWRITNHYAEEGLRKYNMFALDTNALISGRSYRGELEEAVSLLIDKMMNSGRSILFIDEFHTLMNLGRMANGQTPGAHNAFKPYLTGGQIRMIGAVNTNSFSLIAKDPAMLRRFAIINVKELEGGLIEEIAKNTANEYKENLTLDEGVHNIMMKYASSMSGVQPDKTIDFIDFAIAYFKAYEITEVGEDQVTEAFNLYKPNRDYQSNMNL